MPEPLLKIQNLSFSYGESSVLNDLSLKIGHQEIVTLIGSSGTGKTTLLKILTGILPIQTGSINFAGSRFDSVAYMTQEDLLLPWRTVKNNIMLPFELRKNRKDTPLLEQEIKSLLSHLKLEECLDKYPHQLSVGMRQRVSLARTILQKKPLLILDEPFGSLDVVLREQVYNLLRHLKVQYRCSILFVTHDFHDAIYFSDRILLMHKGDIKQEWCTKENPLLHNQISQDIRDQLFNLIS